MYPDVSGTALRFDTVENCIFHQRLQCKLDNLTVVQRFIIHLNVHGNGAAVAVALNGEIVLQQR